ncbi:MAG: transcription termination/antitermination protein NusG [Pirellulales bacterium]|nr:transcription termination/antitermination protein NusG [Pirellulales bacterium]
MSSNPEESKPVDDVQDQPIPEDAVAGNADEQAVESLAEATEEASSEESGDDAGQLELEAEAPAEEEASDDSDAEAEAPAEEVVEEIAEEASDDADAEAEAPAEEEASDDSDAEAEAPAEEEASDGSDEEPSGEESVEEESDEVEESAEVTQENTSHDVGDEEDVTGTMQWYILKVQVNREDSIRDALVRRIKMHGLEEFFGDVVVPTEDIAEFNRSGKRRIVKKKLFPGYIMVNMVINDDTWFLVRETSGIGDFTGTFGKPTPMSDEEVRRIIQIDDEVEEGEQQVKTAIPFKKGDRVRVKDGNFQNFEGEVDNIDEASGRVTIIVSIFGRSTPVELEHWQIEEV